MYFIGIDPGKSGAFAVLDDQHSIIYLELFTDWTNARHKLYPFSASNTFATLELVHAMPRQGVVSMFSFAENYGAWQGLLHGLGIPFQFVTPQRWQKTVLDFLPTKQPKADGESVKEGSARAARNRALLKSQVVSFVQRRLPAAADAFPRKKDWDKADALCLALYSEMVYRKTAPQDGPGAPILKLA